jgi:hypothetical protein
MGKLAFGDREPGKSAFDCGFEVLSDAAVAIEPSESAFDDPLPTRDLKPIFPQIMFAGSDDATRCAGSVHMRLCAVSEAAGF